MRPRVKVCCIQSERDAAALPHAISPPRPAGGDEERLGLLGAVPAARRVRPYARHDRAVARLCWVLRTDEASAVEARRALLG